MAKPTTTKPPEEVQDPATPVEAVPLPSPTPEEAPKARTDGKVLVDANKLDNILQLLKDHGIVPESQKGIPTARIKRVAGKYCVGFTKQFDERDAQNRLKMYIELVLRDAKGAETTEVVDYQQFVVNNDYEVVEITDFNVKQIPVSQGTVTRKVVEGRQTIDTGIKVNAVVTNTQTTATVKLPDGQTFTMDAKYLNL